MNLQKLAACLALIALVVSLVAVFLPQGKNPGEALESALDKVRESGAVTACYIVYLPFVEKDAATGRLSGTSIELAELIFGKTKTKISYVESTWANIVLDLKTNKCEINVSGIYPLIERAYGGVMFSKPFGYVGNNGVVKADDDKFRSLEELNRPDITIAVVEGEQGHEYARRYLPKAKLHVISSSDISLAFVEVSSGRADVGLGDDVTIELYLKEHKDVKRLLKDSYLLRATTFAVRDDDQKWLNYLNNAIDSVIVSGELEEIYKKHNVQIQIPEK